MNFTQADAESLADKIAGLELTDGETAALGALIANAAGDEVEGFSLNFEEIKVLKSEPLRAGINQALGYWWHGGGEA